MNDTTISNFILIVLVAQIIHLFCSLCLLNSSLPTSTCGWIISPRKGQILWIEAIGFGIFFFFSFLFWVTTTSKQSRPRSQGSILHSIAFARRGWPHVSSINHLIYDSNSIAVYYFSHVFRPHATTGDYGESDAGSEKGRKIWNTRWSLTKIVKFFILFLWIGFLHNVIPFFSILYFKSMRGKTYKKRTERERIF